MPVKLRNRLSQMYDPNEENVRPHFVLRLELALDYKLAYAEQIKDQRLCKGQHLQRNTGTSEWMCHKALTGQCFSGFSEPVRDTPGSWKCNGLFCSFYLCSKCWQAEKLVTLVK